MPKVARTVTLEMPIAKKSKYDAKSGYSKSGVAGSKLGRGSFTFSKKKGSKLSAGMRAEIKKIVESGREVKVNTTSSAATNLSNWVDATSGYAVDLTPNNIDEGVSINDRVGQEIKLKSATLQFNLKSGTTQTEAWDVLLVVIKNKNSPGSGITFSNSDYKLADDGSGTTIESATGAADYMRPWNGGRYSISYSEIFQMRPPVVSSLVDKSNTGDKESYYRSVDISKMFPSKVDFSSGTGGGQPVCTLMCIPLQTVSGSVTANPNIATSMTFTYTDA